MKLTAKHVSLVIFTSDADGIIFGICLNCQSLKWPVLQTYYCKHKIIRLICLESDVIHEETQIIVIFLCNCLKQYLFGQQKHFSHKD